MRIGTPKEIKDNEFRVGLTPSSVSELVQHGHEVMIERGAGLGAGLFDEAYQSAGAVLCDDSREIFRRADIIVKVKEPLDREYALLRPGQVLFTYLHLAPDLRLTRALMESGATCIAYETVTGPSGGLPLLKPMSEIAGRLAPQVAARYLEKSSGGRGVLLGGAAGVPPADVMILGGGVAGANAAQVALGMGASVTIIDRNVDALRLMTNCSLASARTMFSTRTAISELVKRTDVIIGTVLLPGAATPKLVTRDMLSTMKAGAVIIDISVDQGGCCETTRPTSHSQPVYSVDGILHYCVTNMPGAVPRTSTFALNNATLPYILQLADKGWRDAMRESADLRAGLNIHDSQVACEPVAWAHGLAHTPAGSLVG